MAPSVIIRKGHWRFRCEPAGTVIRALGGAKKTAARLGVSTELASQWNRPIMRGGTDGVIPEHYWERILEIAKEIGAKQITEGLLRTGRRPSLSGAAPKRKGTRFELQVRDDLRAAGMPTAHRVPLSGAAAGYPGDVLVDESPTGRWIIQCKISGSSAGGRQSVLRALRQVSVCRLIVGDEVLIGMHQGQFERLMRGEFEPPLNWPEIEIAGRTILNHIEGHHALTFRRSGDRAWMAIVREARLQTPVQRPVDA